MHIAVIGLGHTGLVTAAVLAAAGHQVVGHDIESKKRALIREGQSPFFEPDLEPLIQRGIQSENLTIYEKLEETLPGVELIFLAVATPRTFRDLPGMTEFWSAVGQVVPLMDEGTVLAIQSTLPVGTTDALINRFKSYWRETIPVVIMPEFMRQGSAVKDVRAPARVVLGYYDTEAGVRVRRAYQSLGLDADVFLECQPREAEFIKHVSYAFLATKLALANEVALLASQLEIGYDVVRSALAADRRIGPDFLGVGLGFGGSSFPKDLASLIESARAADRPLTVLESVLSANRHQVDRVRTTIRSLLGGLAGKKILQLGLTYKAGTDDVRGSPAVELAFGLVHEGAELVCHDPVYVRPTVGSDQLFEKVDDPVSSAAGADLIILATDWPEYRNLPWAKIAAMMKTPRILDAKNLLEPQALREAGFEYHGIGR